VGWARITNHRSIDCSIFKKKLKEAHDQKKLSYAEMLQRKSNYLTPKSDTQLSKPLLLTQTSTDGQNNDYVDNSTSNIEKGARYTSTLETGIASSIQAVPSSDIIQTIVLIVLNILNVTQDPLHISKQVMTSFQLGESFRNSDSYKENFPAIASPPKQDVERTKKTSKKEKKTKSRYAEKIANMPRKKTTFRKRVTDCLSDGDQEFLPDEEYDSDFYDQHHSRKKRHVTPAATSSDVFASCSCGTNFAAQDNFYAHLVDSSHEDCTIHCRCKASSISLHSCNDISADLFLEHIKTNCLSCV
jgi:hypothetical protein